MSNRSQHLISLEYVRGIAALTVAVSHYLMRIGGDAAYEILAVISVEVFFPLSGYVLAAQIIHVTREKRDLTVFLVRRWMRTLPSYIVALGIISLLLDDLFTEGFFQYLFFIKYMSSDYSLGDYFPVAWSLAVEEWYYVVFPALLVITTGGDTEKRQLVLRAGIVLLAAFALREFVSGDYDPSYIRIGTFFRLDSICIGFLYFVTFSRPGISKTLIGILLVCVTVLLVQIWFYKFDLNSINKWRAFLTLAPFLFGALITFLAKIEESSARLNNRAVRVIGSWLGNISYSVYLFHLIIIYLFSSTRNDASFMIFLISVLGFCTMFYWLFERPLMSMRPNYRKSI